MPKQIKTLDVLSAELTGTALDYAVAVAKHGKVLVFPEGGFYPPKGSVSLNEDYWSLEQNRGDRDSDPWKPSELWAQAGPLKEKYKIGTVWVGDVCTAMVIKDGKTLTVNSPSELICVCRMIVLFKLGEKVAIPEKIVIQE